MRRTKRTPGTFILAMALIGVLPVIAVLQYNWLAQLSRAETVRMRANLEQQAVHFSKAIDEELMGVFFSFMLPTLDSSLQSAREYAGRLERWRERAPSPQLVEGIYVVEKDSNAQATLYRVDESSRALVPVPWSTPFLLYRMGNPRQDPKEAATFTGKAEINTHWNRSVADLPVPELVVAPAPLSHNMLHELTAAANHPTGEKKHGDPDAPNVNVLVAFDRTYITEAWLPDKIQAHFSGTDTSEYDILVTERERKDVVLYHSMSSVETQALRHFDVSVNIGIPDHEFMMHAVSRGYQLQRMDSLKSADRSREIMKGFPGGKPPVRLWQLYIRHQGGSLETMVARARQRNLLISGGVLLVLGFSIVLIIVYTRRMQRLADQQMAFIAGISHDLKTPIAVMHAAGENLKDGLVMDPHETRDYGALIVDESRNLLNTVEQVLAYAGISFGSQPQLDREVDINAVVRKALEYNASVLEAFDVDIQLEQPLPSVRGDAEALTTVISNLVQNGVKYADGTHWLGIETWGEESPAGSVWVRVQDRGLGISKPDLNHLFEPFYRSKFARDAQIRGNGLGLSIVRSIVDAHGGHVEVSSEVGIGSTFVIRLPRMKEQVAAAPMAVMSDEG